MNEANILRGDEGYDVLYGGDSSRISFHVVFCGAQGNDKFISGAGLETFYDVGPGTWSASSSCGVTEGRYYSDPVSACMWSDSYQSVYGYPTAAFNTAVAVLENQCSF